MEMTRYYARRASEYEQVYAKPERQENLAMQFIGGHPE